jgi:sec-independent protein translocase protein TatB
MEVFGIGFQELVVILIIILLVAGPKDIAKTARGLGRALNRLYRSENYQVVRRATHEFRNLPARLAREAHLEELDELRELQALKDEARALREDVQGATRTIGQAAANPLRAWTEPLSAPEHGPRPGAATPPAAPAEGEPPRQP